jgi:hypothetical protein
MAIRDPRIDAYIEKAAPFAQPILTHLRSVVHAGCPNVEESIKWGMPHFLHDGRILAGMAAFKAHCTFGFWHGRQAAAQGKDREAMGQFVKEAVALADAGVSPPRAPKSTSPRPELDVPDDLRKALARNAAARKTFEGFSPSHRREYIEWLVEAKREETRKGRLAQTLEWLADGKSRHWKYQNC